MKQNAQTNEQNPQTIKWNPSKPTKKKKKWNPHPRAYMDSDLVEIEE